MARIPTLTVSLSGGNKARPAATHLVPQERSTPVIDFDHAITEVRQQAVPRSA
jgi:hypothetical protein